MDAFQLGNITSVFERFLITSSDNVVDAFFDRWPVDLIFRLRVLNTSIFCVMEAYRVRTWKPTSVLSPFFADVRSFLLMLDKCDGVVSGSQVVRLLQRRAFPDTGSDLDIFLPRHGLLEMGRWLKRHGYTYRSTGHKHTLFDVEAIRSASVAIGVNADGTDAYPCSQEASHFATYHFNRQVVVRTSSSYRVENYLVQLVVVEPGPVPYIISNFHSSAFETIFVSRIILTSNLCVAGVMNWFTGKRVVSLFPKSTFVDRISYVTQDRTRTGEDWIVKYRKRGFEIVVEGGVPSKESDELDAWERHVGDAYTWVMPFDAAGEYGMPFRVLGDWNFLWIFRDCRFLLPYGLARRAVREYQQSPIRFEVIQHGYGVAPPGAYLRVSVPFIYRSVARAVFASLAHRSVFAERWRLCHMGWNHQERFTRVRRPRSFDRKGVAGAGYL